MQNNFFNFKRSGTCLGCQKKFDFEFLKDKVAKNEVPKCESCFDTVKPDVVLFGESLPKEFWDFMSDFNKCKIWLS